MANRAHLSSDRLRFHSFLCERVLWIDGHGIAANADSSSRISCAIANALAGRIGANRGRKRLPGQTAGERFEEVCTDFVRRAFSRLSHLRPGRWTIRQAKGMENEDPLEISSFEQYSHLSEIARIAADNPQLKTVLGEDYLITPDVLVFRAPEPDATINRSSRIVDGSCAAHASLRERNNTQPLLHASISCKWTIRSDRAQNSRSEALNLIRNRKGHTPHVVAVTAEPTPGRLASIALGTGDIDCVYHVALPELVDVLNAPEYEDSSQLLNTLIEGKRLRDISDLPLDLAI
jgi:hypothetical protein